MNKWPFTGNLVASSPRAPDFQATFGGLSVPLITPLSVRVELPGVGMQEVFLVDVSKLSGETLSRLVAYCAGRFQTNPDETRSELRRNGVFPVLAEGMTASIDVRALL